VFSSSCASLASPTTMSSTPNPSSIDDVSAFAKMIITAFIDGTRFSFNILLMGTFTTGMLIPLVFSLFASSNERSRRSLIFIFVVVIVALGIVDGIWNAVTEVQRPTNPV
jgi:VIT1/CCC1 family predicted Fe2+/Mn2+ transporter